MLTNHSLIANEYYKKNMKKDSVKKTLNIMNGDSNWFDSEIQSKLKHRQQ